MATIRATTEDLRRLLSDWDGRIDTEALADAIRRRDLPAMRAMLAEAWATLRPGLAARLEEAVLSVTTTSYGAAWAAVSSVPYPAPVVAIEHAGRQAARRVTSISNQSRSVIRTMVATAISGRASNVRLARELVLSGLGLDRVRAGALARYHDLLQAAVAAGDIDVDRAAGRLKRRSGRMVRSRAMTIARTEVRDARGYARQSAWNGLIKNKVIRENEWVKTWHTFHDAKTTDTCEHLHGQLTGVRGAFDDLQGKHVTRPPRHANCRCSCSIKRR